MDSFLGVEVRVVGKFKVENVFDCWFFFCIVGKIVNNSVFFFYDEERDGLVYEESILEWKGFSKFF